MAVLVVVWLYDNYIPTKVSRIINVPRLRLAP